MKRCIVTCLMSLLALFCISSASAQIGKVHTTVSMSEDQRTVTATLVDVERHPEGDVRYSILEIGGGETVERIKVRHAVRDFELYPGPHVLTVRRLSGGEWLLDPSSHGEIIDAKERAADSRRKDLQNMRLRNAERKLCFLQIKQAYDAVKAFDVGLELEDEETCRPWKANYDQRYVLPWVKN